MAKPGHIPWNKGLKNIYSPITLEKMSKAKLGHIAWNYGLKGYGGGDQHYNWQGGISKIDRGCRQTRDYKEWREKVFIRDNFTCQECFISGVYVTAHHKKSFSKILKENKIKTLSDARKCPEIWDISNGITLCEECHKLTDNYKGRAKGK